MLKSLGVVKLSEHNQVLADKHLMEMKYSTLMRMYLKQESKVKDFEVELDMFKRTSERYYDWWQLERDKTKETVSPLKHTFTSKEIMWLIKCAHPDKHGNTDISNTVTSTLLDMK